ncbi:helix-turn-helix domain-containing protein [Robbsia andropogonis]|uniref:helix-turn-helix domain-containing protein n=1 Tax=Robbsia andropogonis TaxID=28092 RepID=UPI003D1A644C
MDTKTIIVELRKRGLSQRQIADACGLTQGAISHIETGRRKNVFASTRDALVELLGKTPTPEPTTGEVA